MHTCCTVKTGYLLGQEYTFSWQPCNFQQHAYSSVNNPIYSYLPEVALASSSAISSFSRSACLRALSAAARS